MTNGPILAVEDLVVHFPIRMNAAQSLARRVLQWARLATGTAAARPVDAAPKVHAVDGVSFELRRGEIFGLVGESGCGKTTTGRAVLRLVEPTAGRIVFDGVDITHLPEAQLRAFRPRMQIVFQDPHAALNPAMTVGQSIMDPVLFHFTEDEAEARDSALRAMEEVGLTPPEEFFLKYPADMSGGQKQRAVLARALVLQPALIVADEPVAMLDMSVRARILELMLDLKRRRGLTYLFITHDLATAKLMCDRMAIMYLGRIVEEGEAGRVYARPNHPYTQALLNAVPIPDPERRREKALPRGEVPDALNPPAGCRYHPRCAVARVDCGWDAADFVDFLERRQLDATAARADRAVLGPIDRMWVDGTLLHIPVAPGQDVLVAGYVRALAATNPGPMADAIASVLPAGHDVRVAFRPVGDIAFRDVAGVRVKCVLY